MVMRWIDGAEMWGDASYIARSYADSNSVGFNTGRASPGARCMTFAGVTSRILTPSLSVQNTWVIGFGFFLTAVATAQVRVLSGGNEQCRLEIENSGGLPRWRLIRGSTTVATSATFPLNQWAYFELKVTVRAGTNGSYELRQNEISMMSGSGVNLANTGVDGADVFGFGYNTCRMDDIYILDDTGTVNTNFKGDSVAVAILPQAEGHQIDFTPSTGTNNAALADDPSTAASVSDYNSSDVNGHEDYYTFEDLPATGLGAIHAIKVSGSFAMANTGSRVARYRYWNGTTEFTIGSNVAASTTQVVELPQVIDLNPNTGVLWTKSDIDGAEFGVEVVS